MNRKIAKLLTNNITNDRVVTEMIMYICNKHNNNVEDRLIDLCLSADIKFVTKDTIMEHMDKVKPLCMNYMKNVINVSNIKVVEIDNISRVATIEFTAEVMAWFKDQQSADKKDILCSNIEEDAEHRFKGSYNTKCYIYVSFKDIDIDKE
jgi:hypothetical protein